MEKRESFTGKIGFVLAAAGSAVGLGNIWRFPYLAAKYGGGIFLLVYIALAITFGFSLMVAEIAIGRKTKLSPLGAFKSLDKRFSFLGGLVSVVPAIILPYYAVIGGWVMKYVFGFLSGQSFKMADSEYFGNYIATTAEPVFFFAAFIFITAIIVFFGVDKGIEKVSTVMMPALILMVIFISIYGICTVDGALEGVLYYIKPDFSRFSMMTIVAAMGQLFYSMSLAMGIMITYGSYMKSDISIEKSVKQIEFFDAGIAFLSGLMIIPVVFAFGGEAALSKSGPSLMFVTLPKLFDNMFGGTVIGAIFFIMVFFAALTSSISLMETVVATIVDKFKISRRICCVFVLLGSFLMGLVSCFGYSEWSSFRLLNMQMLDFFDFISNSVIMPVAAFLTCLFVGCFLKVQAIVDEVELSCAFRRKRMFKIVIEYIAPVCILMILISSVLSGFGIINI